MIKKKPSHRQDFMLHKTHTKTEEESEGAAATASVKVVGLSGAMTNILSHLCSCLTALVCVNGAGRRKKSVAVCVSARDREKEWMM